MLAPVTPKTIINLITDDESKNNMEIVTETEKESDYMQNLGKKKFQRNLAPLTPKTASNIIRDSGSRETTTNALKM